MKLKIKKGDQVKIIAGSDKGKKGTVLQVKASTLQIKVQGVKMMTHYSKQDGLQKMEGFIAYSNVALVEKAKAATAEKKAKTTKKKAASKTA
jgi:large subunit ribosomal protein L24